MNMPSRYPYNPPWKFIGIGLVSGIPMFALVIIHCVSPRIGLALGAIPVMFALMLTVRRLALPRFLEFSQDALLLPTGAFRVRRTRIPYADIEWTQENTSFSSVFLGLRTSARTYEIVSSMLPDAASYVAVRDLLNSRVRQREQVPLRQRQPGDPFDYCFQCSYPGFGEIYDFARKVIWRVAGQNENHRNRYPYGAFRLSDFVVYDATERELFRIGRTQRLPMARFVMTENGLPICTISQRSVLLNRYSLDFASGAKWTFYMPLFTVTFRGVSKAGAKALVCLSTHNTWYVRIDNSGDNAQLVAALAFIHRERLRCV